MSNPDFDLESFRAELKRRFRDYGPPDNDDNEYAQALSDVIAMLPPAPHPPGTVLMSPRGYLAKVEDGGSVHLYEKAQYCDCLDECYAVIYTPDGES